MYKGLLLFLTMNFLGAGCYLIWDVLANRLSAGPAAIVGGAASGALGLVCFYSLVKMWIRELSFKKASRTNYPYRKLHTD